MDEGRIQRRRHQPVAVLRRDLDEIAEHVVVPDLERLDAGILGVARLHRGDDEAGSVAQIAAFVERGLITLADEAAVALDQRQLFGQRAFELAGKVARGPAQRLHHGDDLRRRRFDLRQPRQCLIRREDAIAQARQIARAAASDRQPRQGARHVGCGLERGADIVTRGAVGNERRNRIQPPCDRRAVGKWRGKALCQQPGAGGGDGAVDRIEQRSAPLAGQRARQFEVGAGGGVDRHRRAGGFARRRRQRRTFADLRAIDIGDGGSRRGRFQPRHRGEAIHGRDREIVAQPPLGGGAVEDIAGKRRHRGQFAQQRAEIGIAIQRVGNDHFIGVDARQRCGEFRGRAFRHHELGRRNIDPGKADAVAAARSTGARNRQQVIVGARIQQGVFGQRARRHQPHHAPRHHALVAARAGGCRILRLLAHGDAVAGIDQAVQIVLGSLHRHAAHRDIHALMLAALGQDDAERLGGDLGVLEEQLVEIAHPVEQEQPGMAGLDLEILFHHRRDARVYVGGRCGFGGRGGGDGLLDRHCGATYRFRCPGPIGLQPQSTFSPSSRRKAGRRVSIDLQRARS